MPRSTSVTNLLEQAISGERMHAGRDILGGRFGMAFYGVDKAVGAPKELLTVVQDTMN